MKAKRGKKRLLYSLISVISILGFIGCTIALLYPVISDRWNRYRDSKLVTNYNETIAKVDRSLYDETMQKAVEYNKYLKQQGRNIVTDAEYEPDDYYETLLNLTGNSMMGYVEIPKIDVTEPIYHYSTEVSLGIGVGHIHGSSLPVGGKNTHTVLTGHRGLPSQKFFSDLDKVSIGDKFYIHVMDEVMCYQVYNITEILPSDVGVLLLEDDRDLATLVTCTPYGVNTHRLLVMGERVPIENIEVDEQGHVTVEQHGVVIDPAVWVFAGFMLFILILVITTAVRNIVYRRKQRKKGGSA